MIPSTFLQPRYDSEGFAWIPQKLLPDLLGSNQYQAIVLFLIDGFGWRFFERYQEEPFLRFMTREGQVSRFFAQFPSTTAAHLTTLHTGQAVGEHGVFEWNYYEPTLDAVITPLLFSYAGVSERDTLKKAGVKAGQILPTQTLYHQWKQRGTTIAIWQHREYTPSSYSEVVFRGAQARGYKTLSEALVNLTLALETLKTPSYLVLYYDRIDSLSHEYGPNAPQTQAEILHVLLALERFLLPTLISHRHVYFLLTADHGQVEIDPATTIYLNRDKRFDGLERFLRLDRQGRPLVPAGSPRDFFLYVQEDQVDEAQAFLAGRLEGQAEVRKVGELIDEGYFGPTVSTTFRARSGDLVILPYAGESVWWYEKDKFEQKYYGHHGGLTPQEMEIPLLSWEH